MKRPYLGQGRSERAHISDTASRLQWHQFVLFWGKLGNIEFLVKMLTQQSRFFSAEENLKRPYLGQGRSERAKISDAASRLQLDEFVLFWGKLGNIEFLVKMLTPRSMFFSAEEIT